MVLPAADTTSNSVSASGCILCAGMTLADAAPPPPAPGDKSSKADGGPKAGTFVSTGNRLLDKLERDKVGGALAGAMCDAMQSNSEQ
jgi:hypothetical protein